MHRIVMVVNSDFRHDSRVQREALSLLRAGFSVTVYSLTMTGERKQTYRGIRLINPVDGKLAWLPYRLSNMRAGWQLIKALLREKATIWHGHDIETLPFVFAASKIKGGQLVYDSHELWQGYDWPGRGGRGKRLRSLVWKLWLGMEKVLAKRCDLVVAVNGSCAREMALSLGIETPLVIRNCIDPVKDTEAPLEGLRKQLGLVPGEKLVLYSGQFQKGRGLENLLKAWKRMPSGFHLVFLGRGPLEGELRTLVVNEGIKNVTFLPPVRTAEIPQFTRGVNLGVVLIEAKDLSKYYCLPNKLFEYIAAGIPVLASDLPEIRRLVEEHQVGVLVDSQDPAIIGDILFKVLTNKKEMSRLGDNVRGAGKKLSWCEEGKRLVDEYSKLVCQCKG